MLTPQSDPAPDGLPLSRRAVLAATAALVSATAGCADLLDDDDDDADGDLANDAPAETTVLAHLDVSAVADGDGAEPDADGVLEELGAVEPDSVADVSTAVEARTGLDPLEATEVLVFGDDGAELDESDLEATDSDDWERIDAVVDGDWSEDDVVTSLEATTGLAYEATTYEDESVLYEPKEDADDDRDPPTLGILGDGRFAVGDGDGVRAVLDVRYGDADPVSGPVRDAYDGARGAQLTVASETSGLSVPDLFEALADLNFDTLDDVEAVGRSYAVVDAGMALEIDLHVGDDGDAEELETMLRGALPYVGSIDEEFDEVRDDVELERDGTVVTAAYEGEADAVFSLLSLINGV